EQLRHAQKMEAIGQLSAGVAHNFNNMLTGILPNLELALRVAPDKIRPMLENAREATERAAALVRQLMQFAGMNARREAFVEDVGALVARTVEMCRATIDARITIGLARANDLPRVAVAAGDLEQAIMNL